MKLFFVVISTVTSLTAQGSPTKVSIQLGWKYQFEFAGFIAAKEKGFYLDAGLDVDLREYQDDVDIVSDVLNRRATYGIYCSSIVVENRRIKPIILMGTYLQQSPLIFVARKGIKTPTDMMGKTIMGTADELKYSSLALLLNHFGISSKNARFVDHTFDIQRFVEGKVDVMAAFRSNELYLLDQAGVEYEIIDPAKYGFVMSAVNLFTSPIEAIEHTDQTQRMIDATNRGWKYALDHTDEIIDLLVHKYGSKKSRKALKYEAHIVKQLMMTDFYPIGEANPELTVRIYKQLMQAGALQKDQKLGRFMFHEIAAITHKNTEFTNAEKSYLHGKKKITMCVDPEWYPLEAIRDGKHIGIAADVMNVFEEKLGMPIELVPTVSWNQSLSYAKERKCDIFSLASSTQERLKSMNFTSSYLTIPLVVVTTNEKPFVEDIASLSGATLGSVSGYAVINQLKSEYPDLNIVELESIEDGLRKVESGEIYGYVDNLLVVSSYVQKEYMGSLKVSARLDKQVELGVGVRNDEPLLYDVFEKMVKNLDDATMQSIYNRWAATIQEVSWFHSDDIWKLLAIILIGIVAFTWRYIILRRHNAKLLKLSVTDKLTGLYNRQKTDRILISEQNEVSRYLTYHCALMLIDVDNFKMVNDIAGHQAGDSVLQTLSDIMKNNLRDTDILGRWGGEEFIAILPHTTLSDAIAAAEKLRKEVAEFSFGLGNPITISIGVGEFIPTQNAHECIKRVDRALYEAKESGRNQVKVAKY